MARFRIFGKMKNAYVLYALILIFIIEIAFFELHYFWWATLTLCVIMLLLFLIMIGFAWTSGKSFKQEYKKEKWRLNNWDSEDDFWL